MRSGSLSPRWIRTSDAIPLPKVRQPRDHGAQSWTRWGTHWRAANLFEAGANGKLGHLHKENDDRFDVSDVDLPGDVQSAAGSSFDHISSMIASGGFDRNDFVRMCAHRRCQVLEHEVPTVDEPLGVNSGEEACQILVVESWKVDSVEVEFLESLDEVENITLSKVVWKSCWNELIQGFGNAAEHRSEG